MISATAQTRVLRVITRLNIGGPARQALLLSRLLPPEFPTVLAAGAAPPEEGELHDPEVPVRRVPLVRAPSPRVDARAVLAVRRLLRETRAGLLHTHMAKAGAVGRSAAMSLSPRPRTVHTFHGHVLEGYFGTVAQRAFLQVERRLASQTDALIAVSEEVRDALLDLGVGHPAQYRVIPLGLDLSAFLDVGPTGTGAFRRRLGVGPDQPLVGVVGRLAPVKDLGMALAALAELDGVHVAVVGDGEMRRSLERRAWELGMTGRVHFTGWCTDVAEVLADLDVVALTSRNEGTPVSLIEASAAGRPVVATAVGGVPAVVRDGVTGLLVRPGESEQLAVSLRRLLADPGARRAMGRAGRAHVAQRFGQERLVADIRGLYADLTAHRTGP